VLALGAGRLLRSQLFGAPAADPLTFAILGILLLGVAVLASVIPAFRAARIDPIRALRTE
jgi:ABC-type antimicrobial peptide transport system permease subunit